MPKKNCDYTKTVMYKIVCNDLNVTDCYVGHTTEFTKRKSQHKSKSNESNFNVYKFIRDNGNWGNWSMIEIEKYPCADGNEARKRERYWYETLKATLNCSIPSRTHKEHSIDNKEEIAIYKKDYRIKNIDHIKKLKKEYYEQNRDHIIGKSTKYNTREEVQIKRNLHIDCVCGGNHTPSTKARHYKTKKHLDYTNSLEV